MRAWVEFQSRKHDPKTGERYQDKHGPYASREAAEEAAEKARKGFMLAVVRGRIRRVRLKGRVRVTVVVTGRGPWRR